MLSKVSTFVKTCAALGAASLAVSALKTRARQTKDLRAPGAAPSLQPEANLEEAKLRAFIGEKFGDTPIVVVANREPYVHDHTPAGIRITTTAGGLVTALEPLLRATHGTWVAHASGSADDVTVDDSYRVAVPPSAPEYTLRRVFLSQEEEDRYYSGFSNEALWPLCHNAFTKPIFRREDWMAYRAVNRRFAHAALEASRGLILLQDYHRALAARFIREVRKSEVVGTFWHIPWPSAEIFGICPWKEEVLDGLLALDLLGFHTRGYCNNFLDTVERYVECKVDRENLTVHYRGHTTRVRAVPISIAYPAAARAVDVAKLRRSLRLGAGVHVSVAVDRVDYTKGIVERYRAIERLLERNPELAGRYTLLQIAAPCRGGVTAYRELEQQIRAEADRINEVWGNADWQPIRLVLRSLSREEVTDCYHIADSAIVTPLHDGMNLVAKEYAASCTPKRGALILSEFAGAAEELRGSLVVNPYDVDAVADAIHQVIVMPPAEREWRVTAMQSALRRNTIYDWAHALFAELGEISAETGKARMHGRTAHQHAGREVAVVARA